MRNEFAQAVENLAGEDDSVLFISGDLGYNALESLQKRMGKRFINAGVAEQNMIGVAAGFAYKGYKVFCYSIAPFIVYRCLEQFRNDVGFHNLPVFLVGNGGGYGYGIMGSTHHALEDLACLSSQQNVRAWVPAFPDEVEPLVRELYNEGGPAYLRLGAGKKAPEGTYRSGGFRVVLFSEEARITLVTLGPVTNNALAAVQQAGIPVNVVSALTFPLQLDTQVELILKNTPHLLVIEEHVSVGGLAQQLSVKLLERGIHPRSFQSLRAEGYPNRLYGSQSYHQKQSGLDVANIAGQITSLINQYA